MSIVTKTGDQGTTALMYSRRVAKSHPRIEACGAVDELNAALGLARATAEAPFVRDNLASIQADLITLMGELATATEDLPRFRKDGYRQVTPVLTARLETLVSTIESQTLANEGWATPGASLPSATLEVARAVCRRSERRVSALLDSKQLENQEILVFLNRLSDLLWLLARWSEQKAPART